MDNNKNLGCLGFFLAGFIFMIFEAWLICDIDVYENYSWLSGAWHGFFFPENWVRSLFSDALYKAVNHTDGYNTFFGIFSITSSIAMIIAIGFTIIVSLSSLGTKSEHQE